MSVQRSLNIRGYCHFDSTSVLSQMIQGGKTPRKT
uniref:Uncharacterized protein n=1 Tax=Anguilla anguilla TaxID=7936 RepID=A0A0E9T4G2_ANGAN